MAIFRSSLGVVLALVCIPCQAVDRYPVDWKKINAEALEYFSRLIQIDTTNPPGNETGAAEYVKTILEQNDIPAQILALDPARGNLVARLRGNGSKRPILIMGHTDTVGIQREKWTVDPFSALRKDGYIYGRGTVDDKDNLTACLMTMVLLKRATVKLDRDVIFLAEAAEESSPKFGIDYLVAQHWPAIEAEYALAEGGYMALKNGRVQFVEVTTTEKVPRGMRLVAHGTAGHGSVPRLDNPVIRIAGAVAKIAAWQSPIRLNDTTRAYFERLATISPPEKAARYNHPAGEAAQKYFAEYEPEHYSITRTSVVPTIIKAGFKNNVIPSEAEAYLDVRALPDEDVGTFIESIRGVIDDRSVEVIPPSGGRPAGEPSRIDTEMFQALERTQRKMFPDAITLPGMLTGATDMAQLRARGVQAYGIGGLSDRGGLGGAHSDDERILEDGLYELVQFLWYSVVDVAASH